METFPVAENPQREEAIAAHSYLDSALFGHNVEYLAVTAEEVLPLFVYLCDGNPVPILPGEYVPAHSPTGGLALLLKKRLAEDLKDVVFVPDLWTENLLPRVGRGTICSVLCSDVDFKFIILYARQRGYYRKKPEDTNHVFVTAMPLIEERVPPEIRLNSTPLHERMYPKRYNLDFVKNGLKMLLNNRFIVNFPIDSIDVVELTATASCLLSDENRWKIAKSSSMLECLVIQKSSLESLSWVICSACREEKFCHVSDLMISRYHHYLNPHFFLHRVLLARQVERVLFTGHISSECSWFSNYGWQISYCIRCSEHVGWKFSRIRDEQVGVDTQLHSTCTHPWSQYGSFFAFRAAAINIE